ncbi:MAG: class I SAM-dependent methyltransferase, partial [Pseudomonadota bacterium]
MSNQEQIDYWSGETGDTWVQSQVRIDAMMEPITNALLAQSGDARGKRTLDVGCGCGTTSLALAEVAAEVTGVDVSAPMLAEARRRSAGVANLSYLEADASSVHFDRPFEFAVSRFGVMFFTDPTAAFTHLHGQLAPSAPLLFVCWAAPADNAWFSTAAAAVNPLMPPPPAP